MNQGLFKVLAVFFGFIVLASICNGPKKEKVVYSKQANYDMNINTMVTADEGLDLRAVGELVKTTKNAEDLERQLNDSSVGVNNLDLDENGEVDYIQVTEFGSGNSRGFSLTTQPNPGETQEIATIEIEKQNDSDAQMQIHGNEHIYGHNHYYRSHIGVMDVILLSYLFRPHPMYMSPYGYGSYPGYYNPYRPSPRDTYRSNMRRATSGTSFNRANSSTLSSRPKSPNAGKSASSIKAPLKNPTASQKSFQQRNPSKQVRSGGFGRSTTTKSNVAATSNRTTSRSVRSTPSSRSGGFSSGK